MKKDCFALHGDIIFTATPERFSTYPQHYLVCTCGTIHGIYPEIPAPLTGIPVQELGHRLILPGFVDLHTHAPQFNQIGLGMDDTLLDWLAHYTFPEEQHFSRPDYAAAVYSAFVDTLAACGTTRCALFATIHKDTCQLLLQLLQQKGIGAFLGKVCMDTNAPDYLLEDTHTALQDVETMLAAWPDNPLVKPIITPRFAPTSSRALLHGLGRLALKYQLPVQSHLAETTSELQWVAELFPECSSYADVYDTYHLFGDTPTLMAHCIHLKEKEIRTMCDKKVFAVHCPDSNLNLASGLMPARQLLEAGVPLGLGSDVGAGHTLFLPQAVIRAIQVSKLRSIEHPAEKPLTLSEAFFLATKGGGRFFGQTGSFETGYAADILILHEQPLLTQRTIAERLAAFLYNGTPADIQASYADGRRIL